MFDAEVPSELRIVVGSRGGKRIAFFNCEGTKTSEVLVSGATKDQVILVLTSMRRPELIAETAKESKDNLQHLLSTTAGRLLDRSFPLIKPLERKCCCAHGCKQELAAKGNQVYCRVYHNKLEFLHQNVMKYQTKKDQFGVFLASMVLDEAVGGKANPLQPALRASANKCIVPTFRNNYDFLAFYWKYLDVLLAPLGVPVDSKETSPKVIDQLNRARCLANLLRDRHTAVRLMDGHCGLLLMFLAEVYNRHGKKRLNSLKIELVDIDDDVTQWHQHMYRCPTIVCLTENIVNIACPLPDSTLLYLNFCGVAASFDAVREYLKKHPTQCLISFSTARAAGCKDYEMSLISLRERFVKKLPSQRVNFVTYVVTLKAKSAQAAIDV